MPGTDAIPALEGTGEGCQVGVAENPGKLGQADAGFLEVALGHGLAGLVQELLEGGAFLGQVALKRAGAEHHVIRHQINGNPAVGQKILHEMLDIGW